MYTGKKIAFIGCSYSSYDDGVENLGDSWTYQLYQKFPQHSYRNYARGGRGPDYFSWAILDAKLWGADIIFVSSSHAARGAILIDGISPYTTKLEWEANLISENYYDMNLQTPHIWCSAASKSIQKTESNKDIEQLAKLLTDYSLASDQKLSYETTWYQQLPRLYNFEHIFVLNFTKWVSYGQISNIQTMSVWEMLGEFSNCGPYHNDCLAAAGICISEDNDHWTYYGHNLVLNHYVLTKEVLDALT